MKKLQIAIEVVAILNDTTKEDIINKVVDYLHTASVADVVLLLAELLKEKTPES